MSFADFFQKALVTGIVTFLHQVKNEINTGNLNKQTATTDAIDSLLVAAVSSADALSSPPAKEIPVDANKAVSSTQTIQTSSEEMIVQKTPPIASENGDASPQS